MYTHEKKFIQAGELAAHAKKAIVLLHGRGGTAQGILSLQRHLQMDDALLLAPQATDNTWYPYSFLAPEKHNQPALDSALAVVENAVDNVVKQGIPWENIYFVGFSQGACLTLEYVGRHAKRYGGVISFTGGLIGETLDPARYQGDFQDTPILVTSGDRDPHVPLSRVEESVAILRRLGADVTMEIYPGKPHGISADETLLANDTILHPAQGES